jgi:hypothetical protein
MAKRPVKQIESPAPAEHRGVVVGWTHNDLGSSIDLRIQSATSQQALNQKRVDRPIIAAKAQASVVAAAAE